MKDVRYSIEKDHSRRQLVLHCGMCGHVSDLNDPRCWKCAVEAAGKNANIDELILRRSYESLYHSKTSNFIKRISEVSGLLQTYMDFNMRNQKSCRKCSSNPAIIYSAIKKSIETGPEDIRETFNSLSFNSNGDFDCQDCLHSTQRNVEDIKNILMGE